MSAVMAETSGVSTPPPGALVGPIPDGAGTLAKGEFGKAIGVSAGRVSQYIAAGKISGDALVGEGRDQRVHVERAKAQLRRTLDVSQMTGNGLDTNLRAAGELPLAAAPGAAASPPIAPISPITPGGDTIEDQIKRERLESVRRDNRRKAEEEAARAGRYVAAEASAQEMGRLAGQDLALFESALADFSTAIAANLKVPQRDVLHLLRIEFRAFRARAAASLAAAAQALPRLIEDGEASSGEADDAMPASEPVEISTPSV